MTRNQWLRDTFHPLVIAGMVGCIAVAFADLLRLIDPTWSGVFLVAACILTALEACYSYRLLKARGPLERKTFRFRAIELVLLLIVIKIGNYIGDSIISILTEVQAWPSTTSSFLTREDLVAFTLALLAWLAATETMKDLDRLQDPPEYHRDTISPSQGLSNRFLIGGVLLFIVSGLSHLRIASLLDLGRPSTPGLVLNVLIYFLLGLVLMGQTQYTTLHRRWRAQSVKVTDKLAARWVRYSLVFIGLITLVVFMIPTGYTMGFLEAVGNAFVLLNRIAQFILSLLIFIVSIPIWLLMSLFKADAPPPSLPMPSPQPVQPTQAPVAALPWFETLRSLVFWIVALGIVFYVIRSYLRDHPQVREALSSPWLIRSIRNFLVALWRRLSGVAEAIGARIPRRLSLRKRDKAPRKPVFRFFRLGALSPRERTLYYYLSVLQRAGQQGFRRKNSQTPYEYDAVLEPHLPQAQQEMGLLTDDFVEARYSPHPINREKEREVRTRWERVKAALRTLKKMEIDS
ncbi:MAG: DUF4129 domain-containing protein [Anaerolineae bacterium]|nr:DUF4129 domain-containing protein [Anaerolineae bacterium]